MANRKIPDTVIQAAVMTDLPRLLADFGIELKQYSTCFEYGSGSNKVTLWQDRSDGHWQWKRQYDGVSGNAIQWVLSFGGSRSFADAVYYLYDRAAGHPVGAVRAAAPPPDPPKVKAKDPVEFRLPPANKSFSRVMAYLCRTRAIDADVVTAFHRAGLIYESTIYHNAVFVGHDKAGTPRHANLRSTVTSKQGRAFRINQAGSNAAYGFNWRGESGTLFVCEAPIDVLSLICLQKQDWQVHSYLALCGTFTDALVQFLTDQPNITEVVLALDNDEAGHKGTDRCIRAIRRPGLVCRVLQPQHKDWNEDLIAGREVP